MLVGTGFVGIYLVMLVGIHFEVWTGVLDGAEVGSVWVQMLVVLVGAVV